MTEYNKIYNNHKFYLHSNNHGISSSPFIISDLGEILMLQMISDLNFNLEIKKNIIYIINICIYDSNYINKPLFFPIIKFKLLDNGHLKVNNINEYIKILDKRSFHVFKNKLYFSTPLLYIYKEYINNKIKRKNLLNCDK